jgi:hypothetical protein
MMAEMNLSAPLSHPGENYFSGHHRIKSCHKDQCLTHQPDRAKSIFSLATPQGEDPQDKTCQRLEKRTNQENGAVDDRRADPQIENSSSFGALYRDPSAEDTGMNRTIVWFGGKLEIDSE